MLKLSLPVPRTDLSEVRKEFAMFSNATLHDTIAKLLETAGPYLLYGSPLLLLAGIIGFAVSITIWLNRS